MLYSLDVRRGQQVPLTDHQPQLERALTLAHLATFLIALGAGVTIMYAILLACTGLVFWSPGFLFTWVLPQLAAAGADLGGTGGRDDDRPGAGVDRRFVGQDAGWQRGAGDGIARRRVGPVPVRAAALRQRVELMFTM